MSAPTDDGTGKPLPDPIFDQSAADEVVDELAFHLEMRARELAAQGHHPDTALRMARERFDDLARTTAELQHLARQREHAVKRTRYLTDLAQDIQFAWRMLRKRIGFALMAILPLALGIGAATAMYSVVDGVMLRPLPFVHPERLVAIWATESKWKNNNATAIAWNSVVIGQADYLALRERARTLSAVAAWGRDGGMFGDAAGGFEQVGGVRVTSSIFNLLGIRPVLGRAFQPNEDVVNGPHVALLGWEMWQRRFGGDSTIVGRSVTFDDSAYTVVGVMPPGLRLERTLPPPAIWFPAFQSHQDDPSKRNRSYLGLGRLAPGATVAQANADVAQIIADVKTSWKGNPDGTSGRTTNWQEDQVRGIRASLLILAGAVGLLLLIACVNVATLMFGEAARRQPEITARIALGATPARLARQLLTESLVIAGCGAALGLVLGWGLTRALVALAPGKIPGLADVRFDGRVFGFTAICAVVTGIAFGVLPTFVLLRWGRHSAARVGAGQTARGEHGIQRALVAIEVALSLVMLVGCSLLGRSLVRLSEVDPGFAPNGLLFVQVSAPLRIWADSAYAVSYRQAAVRELQAIPGVAAVSGSNGGLFNGNSSSSPLKIVGRPADEADHNAQQRVVLADYFHTMRVPIVAGRDFSESDNSSTERVAIISSAEAHRDFPGESPIGQRVIWQGQEWMVIGVAADVHYTGLATDFQPTIYIPDAQSSGNWVSFLVRASGSSDGTTLIRAIHDRIAALNPATVVKSVDPVPTLVEHSYAEERYRALLGSLFGIIGSVLAGVGMFGVISRTVARRMREAGIRVALGAPPPSLTRLMLRETVIGASIGVVIGVPAAMWLARALTPYLFGIRAYDPVAYVLAIGLLAFATLVATVPPARRAARVDPVTVLRAE
jgi:putative ABC transport system permease protein